MIAMAVCCSDSVVTALVAQSCLTLWTPWTVARQSPMSMEFSRQEYSNGIPLLSPRDLLDPSIEPGPPTLPVDSLLSEPAGKKPLLI